MAAKASVSTDQRGFSIPELLTGAAVSVMMLAGIMQLFILGTRHLQARQQQAIVADNVSAAMQQMVNEIHWAVTDDPRASGQGADAAPFRLLPQLPYNCVDINACVVGATDPVLPAVPALGKFPHQAGPNQTGNQWFPVPQPMTLGQDQPESNYMAFYKVVGGVYHRISFVLDDADANDPQLVKFDIPFDPASSPPQPGTALGTVLLHHVKEVQFTYPLLLKRMADDPNLDAELTNILNTKTRSDLEQYLNQNFRGVVGIRLVCYVPTFIKVNGQVQLDKGTSQVQELQTEVTVRN